MGLCPTPPLLDLRSRRTSAPHDSAELRSSGASSGRPQLRRANCGANWPYLVAPSALQLPVRLPGIAEQIPGGSLCSVGPRLGILPSLRQQVDFGRSTDSFGSDLPFGCYALSGGPAPLNPPSYGSFAASAGFLMKAYME